jgi:hypothetical protein
VKSAEPAPKPADAGPKTANAGPPPGDAGPSLGQLTGNWTYTDNTGRRDQPYVSSITLSFSEAAGAAKGTFVAVFDQKRRIGASSKLSFEFFGPFNGSKGEISAKSELGDGKLTLELQPDASLKVIWELTNPKSGGHLPVSLAFFNPGNALLKRLAP